MNDFTEYNPALAVGHIRKILNVNLRDGVEKKRGIPNEDATAYHRPFKVNVCALAIDIRDSSKLPIIHGEIALAKIYQVYISEVVRLMRSCRLHRYFSITGDAVLGVFNAPAPEQHVPAILSLGCRLGALIDALNIELTKKGYMAIRVGIGMAYGSVLMVKAGQKGSGVCDHVWMGDAVNRASKLSNAGSKTPEDARFMIDNSVVPYTKDVLNFLYQQGVLMENHQHGCWQGNLVHIATKEAFDKAQKPKPALSFLSYSQGMPMAQQPNIDVNSLNYLFR